MSSSKPTELQRKALEGFTLPCPDTKRAAGAMLAFVIKGRGSSCATTIADRQKLAKAYSNKWHNAKVKISDKRHEFFERVGLVRYLVPIMPGEIIIHESLKEVGERRQGVAIHSFKAVVALDDGKKLWPPVHLSKLEIL